MDGNSTDRRVLLGNEAIARGLVEAGCQFITAYPGTPSSEILPAAVAFATELGWPVYAEWSTNEKVALETALAAAYTGKRAAVVMKQVGLNVAADPAVSAAYVGVVGGLVLIVADDPGPHSSQTEQDSRLFSVFAKMPALDPSGAREAKDLVAEAFALSERHQLPILLRPTVRVCHSEQIIECGDIRGAKRTARYVKAPTRWAATPKARTVLHRGLNRKLAEIEDEFAAWPGNRALIPPDMADGPAPLGIVAAGVSYSYLGDLLDELGLAGKVPVLKIATAYPLPRKLVAKFATHCARLLVIEETDAAIEMQIRGTTPVLGRLTGHVPADGELTPDVIGNLLVTVAAEVGLSAEAVPADALANAVAALRLPVRRPTLCSGCGHRAAFYALKKTYPDAIFPGDIGCYTLGLNLGAVDTVHDMGASITMAAGFYHSYAQDGTQDGMPPPIFATIGDGTFFHSGAPGLENAVASGARFVLLVLDNGTTAMTGGQPTPAAGKTADGRAGFVLDLERLIRGCGIEYLVHADPHDLGSFQHVLLEAHRHCRSPDGGVAVVLARYACIVEQKGLGPYRSPIIVDLHYGPVPRSPQAETALAEAWMPRHVDRLSPCSHACPAGNDIERMMALAKDGKWKEAATLLHDGHPFPAVLGRVCPHPCENACSRGALDGAVAINAIERMTGDLGGPALARADREKPNGRSVAIVGGGPSGLTAAYQLARRGYAVEVFEAMTEIGGMLRWAITEHRLPDTVLRRELAVFQTLGIDLHLGRRLGESLSWAELERFDAICLATGAWKQRRLTIAGEEAEGVSLGLDYLRAIRSGEAVRLGGRVAVIGGGNTAIDAARTARRQGAEVNVYYDVLLAISEEVEAARSEGIIFHEGVVPERFAAGMSRRIAMAMRNLGAPPSADGPQALEAEDAEFDHVLVCIGGDPDLAYAAGHAPVESGRLKADAWGRTSSRRIFAGGDASSSGSGTVVGAIASGRRAAQAIDECLSGRPAGPTARTVVPMQDINLPRFAGVARGNIHRCGEAVAEARDRCFHCGVCTYCDLCIRVCPVAAISFADGAYHVDPDKCTGCRLCAKECPRGAISMPPTGVCVGCQYCTTSFECPSLRRRADGLVEIDRHTCIDCGVCVDVCPQEAIRPRNPAPPGVRP